jgi:glutaredoxin
MEITLLYFDECPHWPEADAMLTRLARERTEVSVTCHTVDTDAEAQRLGFRGSPTILIDGIDPWVQDDAPIGLSCRVYMTPVGVRGTPTWDELLAAVNTRS